MIRRSKRCRDKQQIQKEIAELQKKLFPDDPFAEYGLDPLPLKGGDDDGKNK